MTDQFDDQFDHRVAGVAALAEPVRRTLYRYVIAQPAPVGREQAALGVGVPHHVAKFHLDRLVTDGLLEVEYARPPGRSGPGAGRPAKLYRRTDRTISVSLPERRYDLAGLVLAEAITRATGTGTPIEETLREAAETTGRELATATATGGRQGDRPDDVRELLAGIGYEPATRPDGVVELANCPFHALAERYRTLVCTVNRDLLGGLLEVLAPDTLTARLDPAPGRCCVTIGPPAAGRDS